VVENDTRKGFVEIEVAVEMEHDGIRYYDEDLEPVLSPTRASWKRGKDFDLQIKDREEQYMDGR
jgi:hypothetical protein